MPAPEWLGQRDQSEPFLCPFRASEKRRTHGELILPTGECLDSVRGARNAASVRGSGTGSSSWVSGDQLIGQLCIWQHYHAVLPRSDAPSVGPFRAWAVVLTRGRGVFPRLGSYVAVRDLRYPLEVAR